MNQQKWVHVLTQFQSRCRAYVMRKGLSLVRVQFEDVVQEIDGGLDHLQWRGSIIPKPYFTDTECLLLQYERAWLQSHGHLNDSVMEEKMEDEDSEKSPAQPEILVPERDDAPEIKDRDTSTLPTKGCVDTVGKNMDRQNLTEDSAAQSSGVHSDVNHDNLFQTEPSLHSVFKDTEHSPESLKQQRSTLAMELLWIQQAISSRKKYLALKQRMEVSQ